MKELICIVCPNGCHLQVDEASGYAVSGNQCPRGAEYGRTELLHPTRVLTTTVRLEGGALPRLPVKSSKDVPKPMLRELVLALRHITVPMLGGVLTALTDETIQLFSEGRSSQVTDVWLDSAGVLAGILVAIVLLLACEGLYYHIKRRHE